MGAEKVRNGVCKSFAVRERVLGPGVTGLGSRGVRCVRSDAGVLGRVWKGQR